MRVIAISAWVHSQLRRKPTEQHGLWRLVTLPLSLLYSLILRWRAHLYARGWLSQCHLPGFCISVGNLVVGGTGKTPLTLELVRLLEQQGYGCVILTRGYGSGLGPKAVVVLQAGQVLWANPAAHKKSWFADEAMLQSQSHPQAFVVIGARRHLAAQAFVAARLTGSKPLVWILDDGFQHLRIHRDLNLLLADARCPWANGWVLPAGLLREPLAAAQRCDALLLTRVPAVGVDLAVGQGFNVPVLNVFFHTQVVGCVAALGLKACSKVAAQSLAVVSGIAHPQQFLESLQAQGFTVCLGLVVADHRRLPRQRLRALASNWQALAITAKDYWREPQVFLDFPIPVYVFDVQVQVADNALQSLLLKSLPQATAGL